MPEPALRPNADSTPRWRWLLAIPVGALLAGALFPFDGAIALWASSARIGGDIRREMEALQQFGQGSAIVLVVLLIWTLDPGRRGRLVSYVMTLLAAIVVVQPMKMLVGRPRPKFDDPGYILGPFGSYPVDGKMHSALEMGTGISSDLWSMPSSHTAYAVVMAVFLGRVYPRAWWVFAGLAVIVGVSRVLFGAHYPSDVVMGAGIGIGMTLIAPEAGTGRRGGPRTR